MHHPMHKGVETTIMQIYLNIICKQVALLKKRQFSEMSTGLRPASHMVPDLPLTCSTALSLCQTQLPPLSNGSNNCDPGHHACNYSCAYSRRQCQINEDHYHCFAGLQKFCLLGQEGLYPHETILTGKMGQQTGRIMIYGNDLFYSIWRQEKSSYSAKPPSISNIFGS